MGVELGDRGLQLLSVRHGQADEQRVVATKALEELARHESNRHPADAVARVVAGTSNTELRAQLGARIAEEARRVQWEGRYDKHLNPGRCPVLQAMIDLSQRRTPVVLVEDLYVNGPFWDQWASKAVRIVDSGAGWEHSNTFTCGMTCSPTRV